MSESTEKRAREDASRSSSPESRTGPGFFSRIPSRIWFPAGFVGFFFIVGGWNQVSSSWTDVSGGPIPGSGPGYGFAVGSLVFAFCLALGLRSWWRERRERNEDAGSVAHWRSDLKKHGDDIRFP